MQGISGPKLVAAAANAGLLAFVSETDYGELNALEIQKSRLQQAQQLALVKLHKEKAVPLVESIQHYQRELLYRMGMGFVLSKPRPEAWKCSDEYLASLLECQPSSIWLTFRKDDATASVVSPLKEAIRDQGLNTAVFAQVIRAEEATQAALAGADALVLHAAEERGPGLEASHDSLTQLLDSTTRSLKENNVILVHQNQSLPLLLASGGVKTGSDIRWAVKTGFDGVCMSSRFIMNMESELCKESKEAKLDIDPFLDVVAGKMHHVDTIVEDIVDELALAEENLDDKPFG